MKSGTAVSSSLSIRLNRSGIVGGYRVFRHSPGPCRESIVAGGNRDRIVLFVGAMTQSGMMKGMAEVAEEAAKLEGAVLSITRRGSSAQAMSDFSTAQAGRGRDAEGDPEVSAQ